jgi:hypothetical protein
MNIENLLTTGSSIVASSSTTNGTGNQLSMPLIISDHDVAAAAAENTNLLKLPVKETTNGFGHHGNDLSSGQQQINSLKTKLSDDSPYLGNRSFFLGRLISKIYYIFVDNS